LILHVVGGALQAEGKDMLPVIASKPFVVQGALPDVLMQMCL